MKKKIYFIHLKIIFLIASIQTGFAQEELPLEIFIDLVKTYHPFVKQAGLRINSSEAVLLKSRGAFDPRFTFNKSEKNFNGTQYYEKQNTKLVIPTFYGIEFDAQIQQSGGLFLNPENKIESDNIFGIGASIELGSGLWSNSRLTALRQAKLFNKQAMEENAIEINQILTSAVHAYLDWYKAYKIFKIYDQFVKNAAFRFEGVKKRIRSGDLSAIDSTEARISFYQRQFERENAILDWRKKTLEVSNFIWTENQPILISNQLIPSLDENLFQELFTSDTLLIENHPKLKALELKRNQLVLEQRLQKNNLLPQISLHYQWLSDQSPYTQFNFAFDAENTSTGIKASFPIFLRKERANLKLATIKTSDLEWELTQTKLTLQNKIQALFIEKERLKRQVNLAFQMVNDHELLYQGEQKKFNEGESSLFLVNSRESKLIEAVIKSISIEIDQKKAEATYYFSSNFPKISFI